jgi:hypothetical protein
MYVCMYVFTVEYTAFYSVTHLYLFWYTGLESHVKWTVVSTAWLSVRWLMNKASYKYEM